MNDRQVQSSFDEALAALASWADRAPAIPATLDERAGIISAMRSRLGEAWPDATIAAVVPALFSAEVDTTNIPTGSRVKFKALEPYAEAMIAVTRSGDYWIGTNPDWAMTIEADAIQAVTPFQVKISVMSAPAMQISVQENGEIDYIHLVLDDLTDDQAAAFLSQHAAHAQPAPTASAGISGTATPRDPGRKTNVALAVLGAIAVLAAAVFAFNTWRGGTSETASPQPSLSSAPATGTYGPLDPGTKAVVLDWSIGTGNWGPLVAGVSTSTDAYRTGALVPGSDDTCSPATWHPDLVDAWGGPEKAPKVSWSTGGTDPTLLGIAFTDPGFVARDGIRVGSTLDEVRRVYGPDLTSVAFNWVLEPTTEDLPGVGTGAWTLFQIDDAGAVETIMIVPKTGDGTADNVFLGC